MFSDKLIHLIIVSLYLRELDKQQTYILLKIHTKSMLWCLAALEEHLPTCFNFQIV